jgi:hypothetical protein
VREVAVPRQFYKVVLVVDRNFGARIAELARSFHVWAVESPSNMPVIQQAWKTDRDADPLGPGVTSFKARDVESAQEMCARIARDVDEHHGEFAHDPPWSEIEVYGVTLDEQLQHVFVELGAMRCERTENGFICRR